jgi:hypothetical protein
VLAVLALMQPLADVGSRDGACWYTELQNLDKDMGNGENGLSERGDVTLVDS